MMKDDTLLARWLEGSLTEEELRELENSPEYPTLLRMKQNFELLQSPRTDEQRILRHVLSQQKSKPVKTIPLYRKMWFSAAAAILVLVGLSVYFTLPKQFSTSNGQTYTFVLPDASQVKLNAGSQASYSDWNWDNNRQIDLNGEAYFKVAKGKKFTVQTDLGNVTVLGTQFNVKSRGNRFDVVCYEGKVLVQNANHKIVLTPGQKITFNNGNTPAIQPNKSNSPEWLQHELSFDNETLAAVLLEMERRYDVTIETRIQSQQLFSGSVPGNDLDAALKIIGSTYHLTIERSEKTIVLKPVQ